jgi:endonuclease/exonuclease/phosphatase (EEP) superfamily protein YafD
MIRYPQQVFSLLRRFTVTVTFMASLVLLVALAVARLPVLALLLWSRALTVLIVVVLAFFWQQFGTQTLGAVGLLVPTVVTAQESRPHIRILTLNLHSPNSDPTQYVALIRELEPDVIMFQEVTAAFERAFDRVLGTEYPYSVRAGTDTAHQGAGTWSRLPLAEREVLRPTGVADENNTMHRVRLIAAQGQDVWLYNIHFANPAAGKEGRRMQIMGLDSSERNDELAWLIRETANVQQPYILAGDFNSAAGSYPHRKFPEFWRDAFGEAGRGFGHTFPSPSTVGGRLRAFSPLLPMLRIDYVLTSRTLEPVRAWTERVPGTDHLGVVADVALTVER